MLRKVLRPIPGKRRSSSYFTFDVPVVAVTIDDGVPTGWYRPDDMPVVPTSNPAWFGDSPEVGDEWVSFSGVRYVYIPDN